jgi:formimidoylglutamase
MANRNRYPNAGNLNPPGRIVNSLKGDPAEQRANQWLEWAPLSDALDVVLLGMPFDGASTVRTGSRHAPDAVRQALAYYTTFSTRDGKSMGHMKAADIGDVAVIATNMQESFKRLADVMGWIFRHGIVPVTIGGDHSIAWPILEAVTRCYGSKVGVIHFDAHHDLREAHFGAESSGVPFRKALNFKDDPVSGRNLVQIGIADFCNAPAHYNYAKQEGIRVFSNIEVRERGIDKVVAEAIARAAKGVDALYISVDIDSLDHSQAPGTAAPNPSGLDARDVQRALRTIAGHPKCIGLDIVEISPPLDVNDMTANTGAMLALIFLYGIGQRSTGGKTKASRPRKKP